MQTFFTERLIIRPFEEDDYDDLYLFLLQQKDDEFEGYPDINAQTAKEHLQYRLGSTEYRAMQLVSTGKVIGNIYCGNRDFEAKEVGYIVNRQPDAKGMPPRRYARW